MRNLIAVLMLATGLTAMPADASRMSGNDLAKQCADTEFGFMAGACSGYIIGVADRLDRDHMAENGTECTPNSATNGKLVKVAVAYLDGNRTQLHRGAHYLVINALIGGFGCDDGMSYGI